MKLRRLRVVATPHPRRAQMPSRSLPLSARAARLRLQGALSTIALSLQPAAFGRVPPLHDDRPRISVPIATPRTHSQYPQHPVGGIRSLPSPSALRPSRRPVQSRSDPRRRFVLAHLETRRRPPRPWTRRTTGQRRRSRASHPRNRSRSRHSAPRASPKASSPTHRNRSSHLTRPSSEYGAGRGRRAERRSLSWTPKMRQVAKVEPCP